MKKLLFVLISIIWLSNVSNATVTYDNGQHNVIDTLIDDYVIVLDNVDLLPTTVEVQLNGNIRHTTWVYGNSKVILNRGSIGDFGRDIIAYGNSHVEILSGTVGRSLNLNGESTATMSGGIVKGNTHTYDNSTLTIYDGQIGGFGYDLLMAGFSKTFLLGGTISRHIVLTNDGFLEMTGGKIGSDVNLNNEAEFVMRGGNVGRNFNVEDASIFEMYGGWIGGTIYARQDAEITIIGTNFNYPLGYIPDASGTITGTLANGEPIDTSFIREGNGAILLKDPNIVITVNAPNGGERYLTGKPVDIEYITEGDATIDTVDIEYSPDNGSSWINIATGIANTGTYEWTAPNIESENCIVRVSSSDNSTIADTSDNSFIIFSCSEINPADINSDCYVDLLDFVILAQNWLWCGDRYNPDCGL